ncbi:N-acetylmuramoyl-L-alanine amidase [Paenibacillus sp. GCM10023252]|uniref:N-acetylmuramoyl-L-alanine amidase n=1 Tax=Paenibacillus sp. GCM10023252 TaxID=3252649 RepID=UPI003612661A
MKKLVAILLMMSVLFTICTTVGQAAAPKAPVVPKLYLNGKLLQGKINPQIVNSYTLVPARTVTEGLGMDVKWLNDTRQVRIHNEADEVLLTIDNKSARVNGKTIAMDAPAIIMKGNTMVPISFLGKHLGMEVYWDGPTKSVHIYQSHTGASPTPKPSTSPTPKPSGTPIPTATPKPTSTPASTPPSATPTPVGTPKPATPTPSPTVSPTSTPAEQPTGTINSIYYDGTAEVTLTYDGQVTVGKPVELDNPKRIVFDLTGAAFSSNFTPGFTSLNAQVGEIAVSNHPALSKIRFSYYSKSPSVVRLVLDLSTTTDYVVTQRDGELSIGVDYPSEGEVTPSPAPTATPTASPTPTPIPSVPPGVYKVVIDAGHGGTDPGAKSVNGRWEKEFNLAVTLKVKALLDKETKIKPLLTRSNDTFIELANRVKFAETNKANLFISIHANSYNPDINGTETYYNRANSKAFATVMHKHLLKGTGLRDRSVRQAAFKVIKETTMPAILLEAGYLSNKTDAAALFNPATQDRIASEIVAGIKEYLKLS